MVLNGMPETMASASAARQVAQEGVDLERRAAHHVQPRVRVVRAQELDELIVELDRDQLRVGPHPAQDLAGEGADSGAVLDDQSRRAPVDVLQQVVDEEPRARDHRAEDLRIAQEVAGEQQGMASRRHACSVPAFRGERFRAGRGRARLARTCPRFGSAAPGRRAIFYGWYLVVVAWVLYGLQVAGFYSWGFYLPEMTKELSLSRAGGGAVLGVATFCAGAAAPLVGMAITRFGLRAVMTAGFALSAVGYLATSRAQSFWQLVLIYGVFTAGTHAFATIVPTQTLAATWFVRYRARVLAVLMASGSIAAPLILWGNAKLLQVSTWRTGWVLVGILNLALAAIALAFVRDSPESIGQRPDGAAPDAAPASPPSERGARRARGARRLRRRSTASPRRRPCARRSSS